MAMLIACLSLSYPIIRIMLILLWQDRQLGNWRAAMRWLARMYQTGFLHALLSGLVSYLHPRFHPCDSDDRELIARFAASFVSNKRRAS